MNKTNQKIIVLIAFAALFAAGLFASSRTQIVSAKPAFMDKYNIDPYAREQLKYDCTICHVGRGGAERNDFGEAFEDAGYRITPKLRAKFSHMFNLPKE